ncbi:MAG: GGDEF domain-containing protein [Succinivibrio sp.]|nr:GGDEF domain-containing protein [Succinivibrio sp.]
MINKPITEFTDEDMLDLIHVNVDAVVVVDKTIRKYRAMFRDGIFKSFIDDEGDYSELIQKLWLHFSDSSEEIAENYKAFTDYYGNFKGKYSRRLTLFLEGEETPHIAQMTVYPIKDTDKCVIVMDELDNDEYAEKFATEQKVSTIQNTYLFSMFVDLYEDTTSSISVTEISDETVNATLKYTQWRLMIVNTIWPDDQKQFLTWTDPEYLKENLGPGRTMSFDCMMMNLENVYIWVKLIFSRVESRDDEFKFVFMVQNINDNALEMMSTLKKYESLALRDSLTGLFTHGGLDTEIKNSIEVFQKGGVSVSLMMLDLDHFKYINDTYGHAAGDKVLKNFGSIIKDYVEDKRATAGRWGGEEFVIVLRDVSEEEAFAFAEDLRKKVEVTRFETIGQITCSIGISRLKKEDSFADIFNRVDKAMYISKEEGRNRVTQL